MAINRDRRKFLVSIKCDTCGGVFGCRKTNVIEVCAKMLDMTHVSIRHYANNTKEDFWICPDCYEDIMVWKDK